MFFKATSEPVVSIIMPTYNQAHLIINSINAIIKQTFPDWELIIVDNGSDDGTQKLVESIKDKRVRYFHKSEPGVSAARNLGIQNARGRWISFCDSDDVYFYSRLEKFLKAVKNREGLVYSGWLESFRIKETVIINRPGEGISRDFNLDLFQFQNQLVTSAAMVKKSCLDKVGYFDENLSFEEDWELFLRISDYFPVYQLKFPSFVYLVGHITEPSKKHYAEENVKNCRKYIFEKRTTALLDLYRKNKDFSIARRIFLAGQMMDDSPEKYEILFRLEPVQAWIKNCLEMKKDSTRGLGLLEQMKNDPFIRYLIESNHPLLDFHLPPDFYNTDDYQKVQDFFAGFFKDPRVEKFFDPIK